MATPISDFLVVLTTEHSRKPILKPSFEYIFDVCVLENVADPFSTVGKEFPDLILSLCCALREAQIGERGIRSG